MITILREHIVILVAAALVVGFVAGRGWSRPATEGPAPAVADDLVAPAAPRPAPQATAGPARPAPPAPAAPALPAAPPAERPRPEIAARAPEVAPPRPSSPSAAPMSVGPAPAETTAAAVIAQDVWKVRIAERDATKGPADAPVTVVLMTSFGCRECVDFQPAIDQMLAKYGDQVRLVFKHKVFDAEHPDALDAARASLAAKEQGKFWEYAAKLWEAKFALGRDKLEAIAGELELNLPRFKKALEADKFRPQVLSDSLLAYEVGAHSFPNLLANGVRLPKPKNWATLELLIDGELAKAKTKLAAGADPKLLYEEIIKDGKTFPQLGPPEGALDTGSAAALGKAGAKVELVVFEDFECPFCSKASPNLKAFAARYPGDVRLVFKHFPLTSIHQSAQLAAEAAAEAQAQGKFWEFHDKLFANQQALGRAELERYAQEVGLDLAKFKSALDQGAHRAQIDADLREGQRLNVTGTPTVLLNGRRYQGPRGYQPLGLEAVALEHLGL